MILQKQKTYKTVLDRACKELKALPLQDRIEKASLTSIPSGSGHLIEVPFFDETILLTFPQFRFESKQRRVVTLASKIIILHYIACASGLPLSGEKVSYADVPGCGPYFPVFEKRVGHPLARAFGRSRDLFGEAGKALGGTEDEYGDASFTLKALPMVPITFILWEGDEEFLPSAKVLFDRTIYSYLPFEDITVVSRLAVTRILHAARLRALE
jgi:hypothetical protein